MDIQEQIADDISRSRRNKAALAMVENLPTEDIETLNAAFPKLAEAALHELLNAGHRTPLPLSRTRKLGPS